jgi:hypothetical protein
VRARLVDAGNEEPDAVGALTVVLRVGLCAVANRGHQALQRDGAAVGEAGGERLLFHEVGEDACIGGEAGEGEADMFVDGDDFLLVGGEFFCVALGWVSWCLCGFGKGRKGKGEGEGEGSICTFRATRTA